MTAIELNGLKNLIACSLLLPVLWCLPWTHASQALLWLLISGGLGISLGDSFYLAALRRLGTRRTLTVESLAPLIAALGGLVVMGERIQGQAWLGAAMVSVSVLLVARQSPPDGTRERDRTRNVQWQGIVFALLAVFCGVSGAAVSRSILISTDLTAWQSAATRLMGGLLLLLPWLRLRTLFPKPQPSQRRWPRVLLATVLGTNVGIVLQQVVLKQLPLGIGITVLSTAPVMALFVAAPEGDHPHAGGVFASLLAVSGIALAVLS